MVTKQKRRSRYTSVAWSVDPTRHGYVLLLTRCTTARDAKSARPDAAASNHAMDVVKPAQDASIHGQHVIDLRVVHRQGCLSKSQRMFNQRSSGLAYDDFDHFKRLTERQLFQTDHRRDIHGAKPRSEGFVSSRLDNLSAEGTASPQGILNAVDQSFWCQVLAIYEEEVGLMYPFLNTNQLSHEIIEKPRQSYSDHPHSSSLYGENIANIAFLVLAIVSSLESSKAVAICIFFFLTDREKEAWRLIGTIVRLVYEQSSQEEETDLEKISDTFFWSLYTLDRRWSFGTGLPFAVQDSEINRPSLPTNDSSYSLAYLKEMVSFCSIASDVRSFFLGTLASRLQDYNSTQDYLQFRVVQWQQNLPRRLWFNSIDDKFDAATEKRGDYKLRLILYLRANQMRTIILRKAASRFGPHNIDTSSFQVMIQVARDTIQVLARLARETDIYHAQHKTFNHFLETSLSSLLLVTCYASPDQSKEPCLAEWSGNDIEHFPIGLFDIDPAKSTRVDTDPSMFNNLSQILGNCEGFTFF
ncbi:fungal specific transcription factor factor [Fusarium coicis]|nr:fungal specific transcription factor factor [Fusarium coicis]